MLSSRRHPAVASIVIWLLLVAGCGGGRINSASPPPPVPTPTAAPTAPTLTPRAAATPTPPSAPTATPIPPSEAADLDDLATQTLTDGRIALPPATYRTELLTVGLEFDWPFDGTVILGDAGGVILGGPDADDDVVADLSFFRPARFGHPGAMQPTLATATGPAEVDDLGAWLDSADDVVVVDTGTTRLDDGSTVPWWDIRFDPASTQDIRGWCGARCLKLFDLNPGFAWFLWEGLTQRIWEIETPDDTLLAVAEADDELFPTWVDDATGVVESIAVGEPTGVRVEDAYRDLAGSYDLGITNVTIVDPTRPTDEITNDGLVVVEAAPSRSLEVLVGYPAATFGRGAPPVAGPFPLIINVPGLGSTNGLSPHTEALVRAGYVVASVRFPESAWPGEATLDYVEQPADVTAVLDRLIDEPPADLAGLIDPDRIGVVGISLGAATGYGLIGWDCCADDRIDAAVLHAGVVLPFSGDERWDIAPPSLLITSETDPFAPTSAVSQVADELGPGSSLLALEGQEHLAWISWGDDGFVATTTLVQAWFDRHLKDVQDGAAVLGAAEATGGTWMPTE